MELTPLKEASSADDPNLIQMSHRSAKLANVQTSIISAQPTAENKITLQGKIEIDERKISQIPAHFECRIEKLYINFTGEQISKGQLLAEVYSPELIAAQEELLQALKYKEKNPPMYRSARNKLKYLEIADSEIERIETTGKILTNIKLYAHHSGVVLKLNIATGSHVKTGDILFEIAKLNQLWVLFDAYEKDLEWIRRGSKIEFTVASLPGKTFKSVVTFIDPVIDPKTRVAKVRTEVNNASRLLKPEMFTYGTLNILLQPKQKKLLVPKSAVLWTGKESLVYLKKSEFEQPTFEYRKITIGLAFGNHYVVEEGLKIGDEVVSRGSFTIDAAAQLSGKISMMNPEGIEVNPMPGMDMSGMDMK
jgi:Cu(I)/Ag(I) efflux system membrane fusion protein